MGDRLSGDEVGRFNEAVNQDEAVTSKPVRAAMPGAAREGGRQPQSLLSSSPLTVHDAVRSEGLTPRITDKEARFLWALHDVDELLGNQTDHHAGQGTSSAAAEGACGNPPFSCRYFLACGTALGCTREGRFIAHDDDIDIGITFQDWCSAGAGVGSSAVTRERGGMKGDEADINYLAQQALIALLSRVSLFKGTYKPPPTTTAATLPGEGHQPSASSLPSFVCFDVLGSVDFGLQLRFKHVPSGVLVDVNLYYEEGDVEQQEKGRSGPRRRVRSNDGPQPPKSPPSSPPSSSASYCWFATHYGDSEKRRHGMYRYRHRSPLTLVHRPFYDFRGICVDEAGANPGEEGRRQSAAVCDAAAEPDYPQLLVLGETHLTEYFGPDWRIPKVYGYEEGLRGEYKNIIAE